MGIAESEREFEANGGWPASRQDDWRERVMDQALRGLLYNQYLDALLFGIRRHRPGCACAVLAIDRRRLCAFVEARIRRFRSVLSGAIIQTDQTEARAFAGWYTGEWEGASIEIVLVPGCDEGMAVCVADDEATATRLSESLKQYAERPSGRCLVYAHGWQSSSALDAEIGKVTWDDLVLEPALMASVRESIESFVHHREAYTALGFPWKRGLLFIGPPGTGKTMICKAAAASFPDWPFLYVRDLREYYHEDAVQSVFARARKLAPCILAFEDIDGMVSDGEMAGCGNRAVFLNELDGFQDNEGLLILASSNHPGQIDEALLKRPSRFDRVFHIGLPQYDERRRFCARVLGRMGGGRLLATIDIDALARTAAERAEGFTPAYLKEAFVAAALQRAQSGSIDLDGPFAQAVLSQIDELRAHLRRMRDPEALADLCANDEPIGFRR